MCLIENKKTKEVLTINRVKDWCGVAFPGGHMKKANQSFYQSLEKLKKKLI